MLNTDYREMLQLLLEEQVKFIIVGAYALGAHGYPRATGDIDIWVEPSPDNAKKVIRTLIKFKSPLFNVSEKDFETEGTIFQIGVAPRRIDLITKIDGVDFQTAYSRKNVIDVDGLPIPVLAVEDLITNKESTGREKDALDAKILRKGIQDRKRC
jgi:predicted nucleotidyltransferase